MKLFTSQSTEEKSKIVACHGLIEFLFEHFDTGDGGFEGSICDTDDFDISTLLQCTAFDTTSDDSTATSNREDIYD